MDNKHDTLAKILPQTQVPDAERDELPEGQSRPVMMYNISIALVTAILLAVLIIPGALVLKPGDIAPRSVVAPYDLSVEYQGPDKAMTSSRVTKGDVIVESGRPVSEKAARTLEELARRQGLGPGEYGRAGLSLLMLLFFYLFYQGLKRYRPALINDTRKIVLLALLLVITVVISQSSKYIFTLVAEKFSLNPDTVAFALPVPAGAMLVCLLFDFPLALCFSFVISVLHGVLFPDDPFMPGYYFLGSIVAALAVIHCKKRTAVLRAGAYTVVISVITIIGIDLYHGALLGRGAEDLGAGFLGGVIVSMVVSVSLPFFETVFDIATDIKLLELLDPNQPLLKDLVYKSPGTYHHSIVIGNLAEAAAEAVGDNPLLARVGAYYHDVGKIRKPQYFIENQRPYTNKHDRLMPSMSSLIISSHVKDGVDMARENRLPKVIVDIIEQHHGTSLITYFYQKARELQPLVKIAEEDYRYPGPRPRTKVAAIIMLSDSVEAASRTLENPTPERIQAMTNSVITRIFLDDQLARCDLTLRDLREIARSFNLILSGIFHQRIDYPGVDFFGDKRRSEHQDKKHAEEAKTGDTSAREKTQEPAEEHRPS
jgi:putative nucleotidyltransferase with HDIG domain